MTMFRKRRSALATVLVLAACQAIVISMVFSGLSDTPVLRAAQLAAGAIVTAAALAAFIACISVYGAQPGRAAVREAERYTRKAARAARHRHAARIT